MQLRTDDRVANIKWALEDWREVVLLADRLLTWERDWFAGLVAGYVTPIFRGWFLEQFLIF
jgi:hypothetical protein